MNWIIKKGDHLVIGENSETATLYLSQKLRFTGEKNEDVLILEKVKGNWQFTARYQVDTIKEYEEELGYRKILVQLRFVGRFEKDKFLDDYIYSLARIRNYAQPIRHFHRKYSRLFDLELWAILEDDIYVSRTIVGVMLSAMHRKHKEAFVQYLSQENPKLLTRNCDMLEALKLLMEYVDYAIVKPAQFLKASSMILEKVVSEDDFNNIGFAEDSDATPFKDIDLIKPQITVIDKYLSIVPSNGNQEWQSIIGNLRRQWKFENLFRNAGLPLTLN